MRPDDVVPLTEADKDEERADSGWKLVHRRVFASPAQPALLASLVGTGLQLLAAATTTVFLAAVGERAARHRPRPLAPRSSSSTSSPSPT